MGEARHSARGRILAPTSEEIRSSRERIRAIVREAKTRRHPFSIEDFEALARTSRLPGDSRMPEKENQEA